VYYKDFELKDRAFVEDCISIIEKSYTGTETLEIKRLDDETRKEETITLNYFKPFETKDKVYNKILIKVNKESKNEGDKMTGIEDMIQDEKP
jgi:hypothetical protein